MRYVSATSRVTFGLVCLALTVCLLASTFGIIPDKQRLILQSRATLCETVAVHCSLLAADGDWKRMQASLQALVQRNQDIQAATVIRQDGRVVAQAAAAEGGADRGGEQAQVPILRVPIMAGQHQWGTLKVQFHDARLPGWLGWLYHPLVRLLAFVVAASFLLYFIYLRRMLEHLDPSSVIPDRVRKTLDTLAEGLLIVDSQERIVLANRAFAETIGQPAAELVGRKASDFPWKPLENGPPDETFPWKGAIKQGLPQLGRLLAYEDRDVGELTFKVNASPILEASGNTRGALASFDDITPIQQNRAKMQQMLASLRQSRQEIQRQNEQLKRLATQDPLTGCLNRRSFFEQFERQWKAAQRYGRPLSCVLLDIDFFKSINDQHGHSVGDLVLQKIANALQSSIRRCDILGRYGGEEFCILLPEVDIDQAAEAAERYRQAIRSLQLLNLQVTASFGVSAVSLGARSLQQLLDEADKSLYVAKRQGRDQVARWDQIPHDVQVDPDELLQANPAYQQGVDDANQWAQLREVIHHVDEDFDMAIPFHAVTALTSALAYRDEATAEHSRRVADLCVAMATGMMSVAETYVLEVAALLHDIGKIGVPDSILLKPGPLTAEEWKVMGIHDRIGVEILRSTFASDALLEVIENHHAFYGGSGRNPNLPKGKQIPLGARILMIADAYDAMVSDRVYRKAMPQEEAFNELRRCAGTQFDPDLVERFVEVVQSRDDSRRAELTPISKQAALRIGQQIERLARALDQEDFPSLATLAGRIQATAAKQGISEIADTAAALEAAACRTEIEEAIRLTGDLLELCRATQKVYLDRIAPEDEEKAESVLCEVG